MPVSFSKVSPTFGLYLRPQDIVNTNNWLASQGAPVAPIGGEFIDIGVRNVKERLGLYTSAGLVPFVNIMVGFMPDRCPNIQAINSGTCDQVINEFIDGFIAWGGRAFIAPFPEANGYWVSYGLDHVSYKAAFCRLRTMFMARGVGSDKAQWVFAPNGWSLPGNEFEKYYPGDACVDILGFSFFNLGSSCAEYVGWNDLHLYLKRMSAVSPHKPIVISQIGTMTDKSAWMIDVMQKLSKYPGAAGAMYFNRATDACNGEADYRIDGTPGMDEALDGYVQAPDLGKIFCTPKSSFADVPAIHPFSGMDYEEQFFRTGITGGCQTNPLRFCPDKNITRAELSVILLRLIHGRSYAPPVTTLIFPDIQNHWARYWIQALANQKITGGCAGGNFCPDQPVSRAQIAVFLLRVKFGSSYSPGTGGQTFSDVLPGHWAYNWIGQFAHLTGCFESLYSPDKAITRHECAAWSVMLLR